MSIRVQIAIAAILFAALLAFLPRAQAATDHCTRATTPHGVVRILEHEAPGVGVPKSWANSRDLAFVLCHESGFDWCAVNPGRHDCAHRGTNACGLFQRWPCDTHVFRSHRLQARNGLAYIRDTYGSPRRAKAFWRSHHWY